MRSVKPNTGDFLDLLEGIAPRSLAEEWDNPGLQVGSLSQEVNRIVLSLDPSLEAVRECIRHKAQVLLNHHPLFFKPVSCLNMDHYPNLLLKEALIAGISIVAAHTNLDAAPGGINDVLAGLLELRDVKPLCDDREGRGGLGRIGDVAEPMTLARFAENLKVALSNESLRIVGKMDLLIKRAAVVGGAGGSMISKAFEGGADVLVTGDISHHQALEAKNLGVGMIDAGHFCTERTAFLHLADTLRDAFRKNRWEVEVKIFQGEKDPFHNAS